MLLFDIVKLALETTLFSYKVGTFDAFSVIHLSWAALGIVLAIMGFLKKRHYFFWPFLLLKIGFVKKVDLKILGNRSGYCRLWIISIVCVGYFGICWEGLSKEATKVEVSQNRW